MIKLIASDMDGTLLDDKKQLPKNFDEMMAMLKRHGIEFVVASGRSYSALTHLFGKYLDEMRFICDNGAFVMTKGELTELSVISRENVNEVVRACEEIDGVIPLLCGVKGIYHPDNADDEFSRNLSLYYADCTPVSSLYDIDDDIFKIAVRDVHNPINNSYPIMKARFGDRLETQVSGPVWMDLMNKGISKGSALAAIQHAMNIDESRTMAFGDFYNDITLLKRAKYSYVMADSNDDMKGYGKYIAESNNKNGVIKAIYERLGEVSR